MHSELIARLEKATGPDREIDARLDHATRRAGIVWGLGDNFGVTPADVVDHWTDEQWAERSKELAQSMPHYTSSLDAALALIERVMPGALWRIEKQGPVALSIYAAESRHLHAFWATCGLPGEQEGAHGATPALALLLALLRAQGADTTKEERS